jgi:hypothetical protein
MSLLPSPSAISFHPSALLTCPVSPSPADALRKSLTARPRQGRLPEDPTKPKGD